MINFDVLETQMKALVIEAEEHDQECEDCEDRKYCIDHRWFLVALLMDHLGLQLSDLGHIGEEWMKLQFEADEPPDLGDILSASEVI